MEAERRGGASGRKVGRRAVRGRQRGARVDRRAVVWGRQEGDAAAQAEGNLGSCGQGGAQAVGGDIWEKRAQGATVRS